MDYHFHPITGELLGSSPLDESPLEPGVYLHPAFSTTETPPDANTGQVAVFRDGVWSLAPDHRGETWYREDGTAVVVVEIGDPADAELLSDAPDVPEPAPTIGTPRLIATGVFAIADGMMSGMETAVGISAAFPMGPGSYWIFFTETQPNLAYSYNVSASSGQINVTTRDTSFIEVTATEGGVPTDPVEISVQVARVQ